MLILANSFDTHSSLQLRVVLINFIITFRYSSGYSCSKFCSFEKVYRNTKQLRDNDFATTLFYTYTSRAYLDDTIAHRRKD